VPRRARNEWRYAACGLTIAADAPIAGLSPSSDTVTDPDVRVSLRGGEPIPPPHAGGHTWYTSDYYDAAGTPVLLAVLDQRDGSYWLRYSEGAAFRIDGAARCVDAWWVDPLTDADAITYLLGPVLAFLLRLRGRVPLHASGVAIDGSAVLFAGTAGAGKSTTAAALASLGHPLLSDDVVPLADGDAGPSAWPGYPRVSLCDDAAQALFAAGDELPAFSATYRKRYLDLETAGLAFQHEPLPIGQVVVLAGHTPGSAPAVRPLGPREALVALLPHTYGTYLIDMGMRAREFDVLARLVEAVPVYEVRFAAGVETLAAQSAAVVAQLRQMAREGVYASDN
jgi:hypothetical protein